MISFIARWLTVNTALGAVHSWFAEKVSQAGVNPEQNVNPETASLDSESSELLATLAANVRLFRSQRGMTRKGLAEQSGVSVPHLARLEGAQGNASAIVLHKVAKALNVPISALFGQNEQNSGDLAILIEYLRRQSVTRLAEIRAQVLSDGGFRTRKMSRVALVGLRGAGKSSVGQLLAQRLHRPFVELNAEVEREAGMSLQEVLNFYGQKGYRRLERGCLERVLTTHVECVLSTAGGLVVEPSTYELLLSSFFTVWLRASPEVHFNRVLNQHDIRIATPELYTEAMDNINKTLGARDHLYRMADRIVDTTSLSSEEVVEQIVSTIQTDTIKLE